MFLPPQAKRTAQPLSLKSASLSLELSKAQLTDALDAKQEAERALAAAGLAKADLQARVAELQGSPAELAHAQRRRKLDEKEVQLQVAQQRAQHDQKMSAESIVDREREVDLLRFKLEQAEHSASEHAAAASRLIGELEVARVELAKERQQRFHAEDQLHAVHAGLETAGERRGQAAEHEASMLKQELKARDVEIGRLQGAIAAAKAERDAFAAQHQLEAAASAEQAATLAEAREALNLVREAVRGSEVEAAAAEEAAGAEPTGSLSVLVRQLRQQAADGANEALKCKSAEAAAAAARAMAATAKEAAAAAEAELVSVQRRLLVVEQERDAARRKVKAPVLMGSEALFADREETIEELSQGNEALRVQVREFREAMERSDEQLKAERVALRQAEDDEIGFRERAKTAAVKEEMAISRAVKAEAAQARAEALLAGLQEQLSGLQEQAEAARAKELAYAQRAAAVRHEVGEADVKQRVLEEQAALLTQALKDEETKVLNRDEMLRTLQQEAGRLRTRATELEHKASLAKLAQSRADGLRRDVEIERDELREKLSLAMMEVNARAGRLEHAGAQLSAARGEMLALENQLVISANQLAITQQENASLSGGEAATSTQLRALKLQLQAYESRLIAAEAVAKEARVHEASRRAEMTRLAERLGVVQEEKGLIESQLLSSQHKAELLQAELAVRAAAERDARAAASSERLLRTVHEGRHAPLREALKQQQLELEELAEREAGRVLLAEKVQTAEAQRLVAVERASVLERQAAAAELRAKNAEERLDLVRSEMARRDGRLSAMRASLTAAEEELALLKASKELLAARHELQVELSRQRQLVSGEENAVQRAVLSVKSKQLDARDELVRTTAAHAAAALAAVQQISQAAAADELSSSERWHSQVGSVEALHVRNEAATSELEGRLHAARTELERYEQRIDLLRRERNEAHAAASAREREQLEIRETTFHNHCLLVKLLLSTRQSPENVLVQATSNDLYEELAAKEVPVQEWPNWLMHRMSKGEHVVSSWL